ncbi:MAG: type II secretion system ATPase GspE [Immundisolibacter sp.]|uniref:type II secretion system ATPase GspE n=1 Tax=Immundisolibacter sp. TaxID=1934948 RepID=UPI003EE0CDDA
MELQTPPRPGPDAGAILALPFTFANRHGVLLGEVDPDAATLLYRPGLQAHALAEVQRLLGRPLRLQAITADAFEPALRRAYEDGGRASAQVIDDIGDGVDLDDLAQALSQPQDLLDSADDAPIIRLLNALLSEAIREGASDIHIEPFEQHLVVRFRVDGVLREVLRPQPALASLVISRVKVMARLDIAEKRLPQDGRISLRVAGHAVDVRVSTIPSAHGERVVLRLLDKQAGRLDLTHLGLPDSLLGLVDGLIHRPHGILLVTGPTGSGKTTSLYAMLTRLNDRSRNILTVEDPIEYHLDGIGQVPVNTRIDMSFARGLRAILRQDPDVVMVGEIRDLETAQIAVQASLTGHLVLSTLHTNTASGAVTRLRDMGIEPFLLASSMIGIIAQRLVRLLCLHCKRAYTATVGECALLGVDPAAPPTLHAAVGCRQCLDSGYRGRSGVYDLVVVDETLRGLIHDGAAEATLEEHARRHTPSLFEDGRRRLLAGDTSLDELLRVTQMQ